MRYPKSKNVTAYGLLSTTQTANMKLKTRNSRFYVHIDNKNKYFKKYDPEESLKQSIEYINNLQSTEIGLREVTFSMKA